MDKLVQLVLGRTVRQAGGKRGSIEPAPTPGAVVGVVGVVFTVKTQAHTSSTLHILNKPTF